MACTREHFRRVLCALLSSVVLTQAAFVHTAESTFWQERRNNRVKNKSANPSILLANFPASNNPANPFQQLPAIKHQPLIPSLSEEVAKNLPRGFTAQHAALLNALSPSYGTVRKIVLPPNGRADKIIIHIQDVHQNEDAQKNIGSVVQVLINAKQAGLVALEGAFEPIDLSCYRAFLDQGTIREVADYLLKENKISGPIHTAFISAQNVPPLIGIDDPGHYRANVEAYKTSLSLVQEYKDKLTTLKIDLDRRKSTALNPELKSFDAIIQSYRDHAISLGDYVKALATHKLLRSLSPTIQDFVKALGMESSLNFREVEVERTQLIERLSRELSPDQINNLLRQSVSYRLGQIRYGTFYQSLQDLCEKNGVPLSRFPAMDTYIKYVLLSDRIVEEKLFQEITVLEKTCYDRLTKTAIEKTLVAESNRLRLTGRLIDFSLTSEEWEEYRRIHPLFNLSAFEAFYQEAQARDQTMTGNLLKALEQNRVSVAVLVAGGFHSAGITETLRQEGVTVISFVPKIDKVDTIQGSTYLSVFAREKTPLEKLFQGDKLFLADSPCPFFARSMMRLHLWARQLWLGRGTMSEEIKRKLEDLRTSEKEDRRFSLAFEEGRVVLADRHGGHYEVVDRQGIHQMDPTLRPLRDARRFWTHWRQHFKEVVRESRRALPAMRNSVLLTEFLVDRHRKRNRDSHDVAIRAISFERMAHLTLLGLLFGTQVGYVFHIVAHLMQRLLFPDVPLSEDEEKIEIPDRAHGVTGAGGFLGSALARELAKDGEPVLALARNKTSLRERGVEAPAIRGDLLDRDTLRRFVDHSSVIYHLAAIGDIKKSQDDPVQAFLSNVLATAFLAASVGNKRLIYATTQVRYLVGGIREGVLREDMKLPVLEEDAEVAAWVEKTKETFSRFTGEYLAEKNNDSPEAFVRDYLRNNPVPAKVAPHIYGLTKYLGELFVKEMSNGLIVCITNIIGPGDTTGTKVSALANDLLANKEKIDVWPDERQYLASHDLVKILRILGTIENPKHRFLLLTSPQVVPTYTIAQEIRRFTGSTSQLSLVPREKLPNLRMIQLDTTRLRETIGDFKFRDTLAAVRKFLVWRVGSPAPWKLTTHLGPDAWNISGRAIEGAVLEVFPGERNIELLIQDSLNHGEGIVIDEKGVQSLVHPATGRKGYGDKGMRQDFRIHQEMLMEQARSFPNRRLFAYSGNANLLMNKAVVAWKAGTLYHLKGEPVEDRDFQALLFWKGGKVSIEAVRFKKDHVLLVDSGEDISDWIEALTSGEPILVNGRPLSRTEMAKDIYDLRHLIGFPFLGEDQYLGYSLLEKDRALLQSALEGAALTLPWPEGITDQKLIDAFSERGYQAVSSAREVSHMGQYYLDSSAGSITMTFVRGISPHNIIGVKPDGTVVNVAVKGKSNRVGVTLEEAAHLMVNHGVRDALILDNGGDVLMSVEERPVISSFTGRERHSSLVAYSRPAGAADMDLQELIEHLWPYDPALESIESFGDKAFRVKRGTHYLLAGDFLFLAPDQWEKHQYTLLPYRKSVLVCALTNSWDGYVDFGFSQRHTLEAVLTLQAHREKIQGETVLDAGSGDGVLAMVASRLGARHIYAVDSVQPYVQLSRRLLQLNNITNVEVLHSNLSRIREMPALRSARVVLSNLQANGYYDQNDPDRFDGRWQIEIYPQKELLDSSLGNWHLELSDLLRPSVYFLFGGEAYAREALRGTGVDVIRDILLERGWRLSLERVREDLPDPIYRRVPWVMVFEADPLAQGPRFPNTPGDLRRVLGQASPQGFMTIRLISPSTLTQYAQALEKGLRQISSLGIHVETFTRDNREAREVFSQRIAASPEPPTPFINVIQWQGSEQEANEGASVFSNYPGRKIILLHRPLEILNRYGADQVRRILGGADAVVVFSQAWRIFCQSLLPNKPVVVIPHGIMSVRQNLDPARFEEDAPVVVGAITAWGALRNIEDVADLIGFLREADPGLAKRVIGFVAGGYDALARSHLKDLMAAGRIKLLSNQEILTAREQGVFNDQASFRQWLVAVSEGKVIVRGRQEALGIKSEEFRPEDGELYDWQEDIVDFKTDFFYDRPAPDEFRSKPDEASGTLHRIGFNVPVVPDTATMRDARTQEGLQMILAPIDDGRLDLKRTAREMARVIKDPHLRQEMIEKNIVVAHELGMDVAAYGYKLLAESLLSPRPASEASPVNSLVYLFTWDWRKAVLSLFVFEFPLMILFIPLNPPLALAVFSSLHVLIEAWQNPGRPVWKHLLSFIIHAVVASPYTLIGLIPELDSYIKLFAVGGHLLYDSLLMRADQERLARRDMRALRMDVPQEPRLNPVLDLLIPHPQKLEIDSLGGREALIQQAAKRLRKGGPYAREWAKTVDICASFSIVKKEDLPTLGHAIQILQKMDDKTPMEFLLVPGDNDPALITELEALAKINRHVTLLRPMFNNGVIRLSNREFSVWAEGKGSILWTVAKNPLISNTLQVDVPNPHPALQNVLSLLSLAPSIRLMDYKNLIDIALAVLRYA